MAADPSDRFGTEGLTFDDVLLVPAASDVLPNHLLDEPLVLTTAIRALLADWDHSEPRRR